MSRQMILKPAHQDMIKGYKKLLLKHFSQLYVEDVNITAIAADHDGEDATFMIEGKLNMDNYQSFNFQAIFTPNVPPGSKRH